MNAIDKLHLFLEGVNRCGIVLFVTMLQTVVVYYGIVNDVIVDVIGGSIITGGCLQYIWHKACEYVLDHENDDLEKKK